MERARVGRLTLRAWGLLTASAIWVLYLLTLAPTVGFWDASEYVTTAHILGLPHPPGNPLFVVVGRVWDLLTGFTGLPVALRINALGATLSAGASFFWFLAVVRIVGRFRENRHEVLVAAVAAVWIGATAFTVSTQSNLNEKVYPLSMFVVALVSYLAMVWMDLADTARGNRLLLLLLLLIALVLGLGWANHTMSMLPALALAAFVLLHRWRAALNPRVLGPAVALLAVGYSLQFLFVPIRSAQNPVIDEADPECPTLVSAVTPRRIDDQYGQSNLAVACEPLALSLIRDQYAPTPITLRQAPLSAQYANYWQYFDWQWARSPPPGARVAASVLFLFFALVGLWTHLRRDRKTFVYAGTLFASTLPIRRCRPGTTGSAPENCWKTCCSSTTCWTGTSGRIPPRGRASPACTTWRTSLRASPKSCTGTRTPRNGPTGGQTTSRGSPVSLRPPTDAAYMGRMVPRSVTIRIRAPLIEATIAFVFRKRTNEALSSSALAEASAARASRPELGIWIATARTKAMSPSTCI